MTRPRLALLDASHGNPDTPRNFRRELDADLAEFDVTEGDLPAGFDYDGVVVTGSRASVYWEEEAWIEPTVEWVREAVDRGLPFLGICFGHQLLAHALGGQVVDMGEYEIGYRDVERVGDSELLAGLPEQFTVFTTHSDAVAEVPPGATVIAENDYSIHGFRKGRVFGVQFHPEYDPETAAAVTRSKDDLAAERMEAVLAGITPENYRAACETKRLFDNFTSFVLAVRDRDDAGDRSVTSVARSD